MEAYRRKLGADGRERVEVRLKNRGKQAAEVVLREFMYRWPSWAMALAARRISASTVGSGVPQA